MIPKETAPAHTTIFRQVNWFNNLEKFENRTGRWSPPVPEQTMQTVISYFHKHPTGSLRRAVADLKIRYSIIDTILKKSLSHVFVQDNNNTSFTPTRLCLTSCLFLNREWTAPCPILVPYVGLVFLMIISFISGLANTRNNPTWGQGSPTENQQLGLHSKSNSLVYFAKQCCGMSILLY